MSLLINFLLVIHVLVSLLMIFMILMQRPKSEGLGAAFGGGVTDNIFGAQTSNVLTRITGWLAAIFFSLTLVLSILYAHKTSTDSAYRRELMKTAPASAASVPASSTKATASPSAGTSPAPTVLQTAPSPADKLAAPSVPRPEDAAVGIIPRSSAPLLPSAAPKTSPAPVKE